MDDHNEMYEIGLTAPMEMAEEYRLDEMLPMMGLKIGKRCIILISRSVNAAEILDTLETLRCAEEKLMVVLEDACGRCDSVCEAQALPTDSAEKEVLQKIPDVLLYGLRGRGLCLRQLARHLVKTYPDLKERIFGAMQRYPLEAWEPHGRYKRPKEQE